DAATSGRPPDSAEARAASYSFAIPAAAAAAFPRISRDTRFRPAMSTTLYIIATSFAPTYGVTSPDAIVDTISLGTPIGRSRTARAAMDDPPLPPTASTASTRSSPAMTAAAPSPMAVTAAPRSPASRSASIEAPPASATRSAGPPAAPPRGRAPASTSPASHPSSRTRSRSQTYSAPLVSSVPTSTAVAMQAAFPAGSFRNRPGGERKGRAPADCRSPRLRSRPRRILGAPAGARREPRRKHAQDHQLDVRVARRRHREPAELDLGLFPGGGRRLRPGPAVLLRRA